MSFRATRYFPNVLPDYNPVDGLPKIDLLRLKSRIQEIVQLIEKNFKPSYENGEDGLYLGSAGISYMFYHLHKRPHLHDLKESYLEKAMVYLQPAIDVANNSLSNRNEIPSFILGNCGIYAMAATLYKTTGNAEQLQHFRNLYCNAASICEKPNFLTCGSDELFVGRAGYIWGALWMSQVTGLPLPQDEIFKLCRTTIESGKAYASRNNSHSPLMYSYYNVEYLGAAHGLSCILQTIITVPGYLEAYPDDAKDVKTSVDYLLSLQDEDGNFPCATEEIGKPNELVHWCHGAGGLVFLMAKSYMYWKETKYLESCKKMGELVWHRGLLLKGPGICHGVAGNGYVFLLLFNLTQDQKYLHRALKFAEFIECEEFQKEARTPDSPYSLFEGLAGTACFLSDLSQEPCEHFPFFLL